MSEFRYCPHCALPLEPYFDGERVRARCEPCQWIHYRNPTAGVAVVLMEPEGLLLGQRRTGNWCIPCGHVEWDEPVEECAKREFLEETGLEVELGPVLAVHSNFHNPIQHTVGIWFAGERLAGSLRPGGDLQAVRFFPMDALPTLQFITDQRVIDDLRLRLRVGKW